MNYNDFAQKVKEERKRIPPIRQSLDNALTIAEDIKIGRTAFFAKMGVSSEVEYKRNCKKEGRIMAHAHIGLSTWKDTTKALKVLYDAAQQRGIVIDRFGLCLDRRMAVPSGYRSRVPAETGPTLENERDWLEVGQVVPIQPHLGDFMIGFPASTENTVLALKAGVTTIGNLSQYFSMQAPTWKDHITTAVETVKAIAVLGALREQGTLLHSYLEDGLGALFYDCVTVAGWAYLEKYIVEYLLGAKLSHCIGGLICDPIKRAGWVFALDSIHEGDCMGSMMYGDTISFTEDLDLNRGMIAEYLLWDALAQMECPTGHALLSLPVTEAIRVPAIEEIVEAQIFGRRIIQMASTLSPHVNLREPKAFANVVVKNGKKVFLNALDGLREAGVDIKDPLQLLFILKQLGPAAFEEMFGVGEKKEGAPRGRVPLIPTDVFDKTKALTEIEVRRLTDKVTQGIVMGKSYILASTDVHEHALFMLCKILTDFGADVVNLGAERNADEIATAADKYAPDGIIISTHNGMALEFAERLKAELANLKCPIPVFFGGKLNQKFEEHDMPVYVEAEIQNLGFSPCKSMETLFKLLGS